MENQDDLIVLLNDYGRFGWEVLPSQAGRPMTNTFPYHTDAQNKGVIDFQTEFDWQTRHWQYISTVGDRREDFVNFRDKQVNLICAAKHNATQVGERRLQHTLCVHTRNLVWSWSHTGRARGKY